MSVRHVVTILVMVTLLVAVLGACKKSDDAAAAGDKGGADAAKGAPGAMPGGAPGGAPGAMPGGAAGAKGPGMGGPGGAPGMGGPGGAPGAAAAGADAGKIVTEALALKAKGDYKGAAAKFEEAIAADGRNADAHWGMAWVMANLASTEKDDVKLARAKEEFQRFLKVSTDAGKKAEAAAALKRLGGS